MNREKTLPPVSPGRMIVALGALCALLVLAGCAGAPAPAVETPPMHTVSEFADDEFVPEFRDDPWEGFNRRMYRFNYHFDKYVFLPVVRGYEYVTPVPVQTGVTNFFNNIYEIPTFYNSVLQWKWRKAGTTAGRFAVNTTIGVAGFFEVADKMGLKRQHGDFGQTLGHWGVPAGPYLVLPVLGPHTVRSASGHAFETTLRYAAVRAIEPYGDGDRATAIAVGVGVLEAVNLRHTHKFHYYQSGSPFEYDVVRFLYQKSQEFHVMK
jgi:phospholipid-binding lipoprotein MlaA